MLYQFRSTYACDAQRKARATERGTENGVLKVGSRNFRDDTEAKKRKTSVMIVFEVLLVAL
jgi:hypothetical protein